MLKIEKVEDIELGIKENANLESKDALLEVYWTFHPRFRFFKNVLNKAKLLDVGAGSGSLCYWKDWKLPKRADIDMYALDLAEGELFDRYKDYQVCNLEQEKIKFENDFFDAILMSHVLEHIEDCDKVLGEIRRVLKIGGKAYFELPTPETQNFPKRSEFMEKGIQTSVINFFDDGTHLKTFTMSELLNLFSASGFKTLEAGIIENKYLEDDLYSLGIKTQDQELTTYALWSHLRWAQYIIVQKV